MVDNLANTKSMASCKDPVVDYIPREGMVFESEHDAYEFYTQYGWKTGFSIRREYGNRSRKTDQITSRKFTCSKEGFRGHDKRQERVKHPKIPRPETRTGCLAHMTIKLNKTNGKYLICSFEAEHNHPLHVPPCAHMMRSHRKMLDTQATEVLPVTDSTLCKQDHRNHLSTKRQRDMKYGEAGSLLKYFQTQSMENPSFYYSVQLDADEKITNVFWADPRMIINYGQFGDVVSFETKFRSNKEIRPFASFVGFNHHRETIVFGAALLYDETTESFQWLFETFLDAMSGKKPRTIFSDQDDAISQAISLIMPETYHRFCISHMKKNATRNLSHLFNSEGDFKKEFKACINDYEEEDEFIHAWEAMLDKYDVRDNSWLRQIFEVKEKWARPYIKYSFSAGIRSSKLSESLNSNLRDYLKSDMDLVQFFIHFESVFNDNWYKELEAEYNSREKLPKFKIKAPMLMQTAAIYTNNIFQLFQTEYEEFQSAYITYRNESSSTLEYLVAICDQPKVYKVIGDPLEQTVSCMCRKFETHGYLCSHAVKVFDVMDIKYLPNKYISRRWSKGARDESETMEDQNGQDIQIAKMKVSMRYRFLCPKYIRLVSRASESEEAYKFLDQCSADLNVKVEEIVQKEKGFNESTVECPDPFSLSTLNHKNEIEKDESSDITRMKGRKKNSNLKLLGKTNSESHSLLTGHTPPEGMERPSDTPPIGLIIHYPAYQTSIGTIGYPNSSAWMNYGVVQQRGSPMFTQFLGGSAVCSSFQSAQALNTSECTQVRNAESNTSLQHDTADPR
ncbi:protein FAR1-RELATED SEQUENCE 5-like [Canna indica]|uniref:Protein FAR1-RELATED SEQUENCE n=1 Tax=Canna indica TaxID=4628 RepID=A0AAQ3JPR2_9LILI|nr:protein FAR1-RELATED SEQUENCE 5-like [Canna indica]